ncbi:hypothetical protein Tco_0147377 [Tanacetum coccineum]
MFSGQPYPEDVQADSDPYIAAVDPFSSPSTHSSNSPNAPGPRGFRGLDRPMAVLIQRGQYGDSTAAFAHKLIYVTLSLNTLPSINFAMPPLASTPATTASSDEFHYDVSQIHPPTPD